MPKHGPDAVQLLYGVRLEEAVLDIGPDDRSRGFRSHGHAPAFTVRKGIHLFGDDIRILSDTPAEEFGPFEDGGPYLPKTEIFKNCPGC